MRLILCDNENLKLKKHPEDIVIIPSKDLRPCIGCFYCWTKNPTNCIHSDDGNIQELISKSDELIIISKNTYGGLSIPIKRTLDRSISFILPYFEKRNKLTRHKKRYDKELKISGYIYNVNTNKEKETLTNIFNSMSENFGGKLNNLDFFNDEKEFENENIDN